MQKAGGFRYFTQAVAGSGIRVTALRAWAALSQICYLAIGGRHKISLFSSDNVYDITPLTISALVSVNLNTVAGSAIVVINDPINTPSVGQWLRIREPVSVGGIVLYGSYSVVATSFGNYSITTAQKASISVTGGGAVQQFATQVGSEIVTITLPNHGFFTGQTVQITDPITVGGLRLEDNYAVESVVSSNVYTINAGAAAISTQNVFQNSGNINIIFMDPTSGGAQSSLEAQSISLDNWGEFLVIIPAGYPIYIWQPSTGVNTPAAAVPTAPLANNIGFVASQQQILIVGGSVNSATGLFDPLLLRWSDAGDYTDFTPTVTNQAGSFRLQLGNKIVGGAAVASGCVIWTDICLYIMQYEGLPYIWGFQPIAVNCGLIGPHAFAVIGSTVVWMSKEQFYVFSAGGVPTILPCSIWDQVFRNVDSSNIQNTNCVSNAYFNEVVWYVPQMGGAVTKAKLQLDTGLWDYTVLQSGDPGIRSAAIDQNVFGPPMGSTPLGVVYQEETGNDADTVPLKANLLSGIVAIAEGDEFAFFSQIRPDVKFSNGPVPGPGTVLMSVYVYRNPQEAPRIKGPYPINARTRSIPCRGRGRGLQFEFQSTDLGSQWRLGRIEYVAQADGKGG